MDNQEWVKIEGYDTYMVNSYGTIINSRGKYRKFSYTKDGYFQIPLSINGKQRNFLVHRLVAIAFIPNPENKPQVNHKNGIKTDNRVENLEWVTAKENTIHSFSFLHRKTTKGIKRVNYKYNGKILSEHHCAKIVYQYNKSGELIKKWGSVKDASIGTSINYYSLIKCCSGLLKSAGGFMWKH